MQINGAFLRLMRQSRRLTQVELANLARVARGYLSQIECGALPHNLTAKLVDRLAEALNLTEVERQQLLCTSSNGATATSRSFVDMQMVKVVMLPCTTAKEWLGLDDLTDGQLIIITLPPAKEGTPM